MYQLPPLTMHRQMGEAQVRLAAVLGRLEAVLDQREGRRICCVCHRDYGPAGTRGQHSDSHGCCTRECAERMMRGEAV